MGDYAAASSISRDGFARNPRTIQELHGQEVKLWGFVDHNNLYGNEGAKQILGEWWGGDGPDSTTWRFNLKARRNDAAGRSFSVHVPNDRGRNDLLKAFVADARAERPTRVFVTGRIYLFDAPTEGRTLTGLIMALQSSRDVRLEPPAEVP